MIIFQKMKGDKNKKAIKQISGCLEGRDYYQLCFISQMFQNSSTLNYPPMKEKLLLVSKSSFSSCCILFEVPNWQEKKKSQIVF